jgi:outer membrane protein W
MKKIIYIFLFSVIVSSAMAQNSYSSWQYSIGLGSGDLHSYVGPASFRGVAYSYTKLVKPNIGVGLEIGWNLFYDKLPNDTYTVRNFAFNGKQFRYSTHVPLFATVSYYLHPDDTFTPFAGVGIGTLYTNRKTDMGTYSFTREAWQFALRPEIGVLFNSDGGASISLSSKYYHGFTGGDLSPQSYFTINIGFVFNN